MAGEDDMAARAREGMERGTTATRLETVIAVTGAGCDAEGRLVLHVRTAAGRSGLMPVSPDAARDLLHAVPLAVVTAGIRGRA
jgi:hypothetical protein